MKVCEPNDKRMVELQLDTQGNALQLRTANWQNRRQYSRRALDQILLHAFESLANTSHHAVIVTDAWGKVAYLTTSAHDILQSCAGLIKLVDNRLSFACSEHQRYINKIMTWVRCLRLESYPSCTFSIERAPPHQPIAVSAFPLRFPAPEDPSIAHIMITLCDPEHQAQCQWRLFGTQFMLTPAELRLCQALADGLSTIEYSRKYQVTLNTVRSHLKSIFAKTNVRRQAELLLLIITFLHTKK